MLREFTGSAAELQAAIDQLLMEQGEVAPVELLLHTGRLRYQDYEAWREGQVTALEDRLLIDPEQAREVLQLASVIAEARGLHAARCDYRSWRTDKPLRCCRHREEALYLTCYRPPERRAQLDLFYDSREATLINGVRFALTARRANEASRLLRELDRQAPGHPQAAGLKRLIAAQSDLEKPIHDATADLQQMLRTIEPLARDLLGGQARDYLVPHWRRLAQGLAGRRFRPDHPKLHASFAAANAEDWEMVQGAVEAEEGWAREPVLIERHATAQERLGNQAEAFRDWCRLCWDFPDAAPNALAASPLTRRDWSDFQDIEVPLETQDFPAWRVICRSVSCDPPHDVDNTAARLIMERIVRLLAQGTAAPDGSVLSDRRLLKAERPSLFEIYMAAVRSRDSGNGG